MHAKLLTNTRFEEEMLQDSKTQESPPIEEDCQITKANSQRK